MSIQEFAKKYHLRTKFDACGEVITPCKRGQIYDCGGQRLAVLVEGVSTRVWHSVLKTLLAAGFELRQNGDCEGSLSFDPEDRKQAKLAIKVMGAYKRKQLTEDQKGKLTERLRIARKSGCQAAQERPFAVLESSGTGGALP
jgi:hypothetical protein